MTLDREVMRLRDSLMPRYAQLVYNGFWFAPEREALQRLVDESRSRSPARRASSCTRARSPSLGRKAPRSRCTAPTSSTFEAEQVYDQRTRGGFIKLNALRLRIAQMRAQQ